MPVAQMGKRGFKLVGLAVDVADCVVVHALSLPRPVWSRTNIMSLAYGSLLTIRRISRRRSVGLRA